MTATQFPAFVPTYHELKKLEGMKVTYELYHHDSPSEATMFTADYLKFVGLDSVNGARIIEVHFKQSVLTFDESRHHTNLSNGSIVFSSKHDDETYWIINP